MRIARWYCAPCHTTFSALPDCLAARLPGSLREVEDAVVALDEGGNPTAAARRVFDGTYDCANARRWIRCRSGAVAMCLVIIRGILPALFAGCDASITGLRLHCGTVTVLVDLRRACSGQLQGLPGPVGFHPRRGWSGTQRGPPTVDNPVILR